MGETQCAALGLGPSGVGWVKWAEEGRVLFVWFPQISVSGFAFCLELSSLGRLPLWNQGIQDSTFPHCG